MMPNKKFWNNSNLQNDIKWDNQPVAGITDEELYNTNWNLHWKKTEIQKKKISEAMKGKSLDEIIGKERAIIGKESRRQSCFQQDYTDRAKKTAATRKANGSYDGRSMRDQKHKDSTKKSMAIKAKIRQDLKRELNLGRNDKIPKELLEQRYKELGL